MGVSGCEESHGVRVGHYSTQASTHCHTAAVAKLYARLAP
jgi:hypothetical protein